MSWLPAGRAGDSAGSAPWIRRFDMAGGETILVADDDKAILQMIEFMLEDAGYTVVKAADGLEALERIRTHSPDLVLLDFMMPKMDGGAVCERIRSSETTKELPVVIMSANREVVARALEVRASAYLLKPFSIDEMLECVRSWLTGSDCRRNGH